MAWLPSWEEDVTPFFLPRVDVSLIGVGVEEDLGVGVRKLQSHEDIFWFGKLLLVPS